jgi:putative colanic acid biosynthesis UDP-glucose lipid carrier transferase
MISNRKALHTVRFLADILMLGISFIASLRIISYDLSKLLKYTDIYFLVGALTVVWFYSSRITNLYEDFRTRNFSFALVPIMKNVATQVVACILLLFILKKNLIPRLFVIYFTVILFFLVSVQKYFYHRFIKKIRRRGRNTRSMLIIGGGDVGINFYNTITDNKTSGYRIIGVLDDKNVACFGDKYLGTIDALNYVLTRNVVDEVIICLPNYASERLSYVIDVCRNYVTSVKIIPDYFKFLSEKYEVDVIDRYTIISIKKETINELHWRLLKRAFDLIFTVLVFFLVFSWLWPLLTALQLILNPGPVFYKAERWGRRGKSFFCYKFRSMKPVAVEGTHKITNKGDSRITPFGNLLRRFSLDELPQFVNVLKGEMSIVGPRPHDAQENMDLKHQIDSYMWRHLVKPGLTGWAQVNGFRGGTKNIYLMKKRTECDLWYVENWSFWLDVQIIFLTIWGMIKGDRNAY